mgnify:CR=1 FL=1
MLLLYVYVMDNVYFCRLQQCCCGIVIRIVDKIRLFRQKSMRYFTNILRWISSQEHLYFLFGLLFIIPNCVFLFTEPLPGSGGPCFYRHAVGVLDGSSAAGA